jgi:uncharacterized protein
VSVALTILAKEPRPGTCKTRLCPPCSWDEAARLAEAALHDTMAAVAATDVDRKILALDGELHFNVPCCFAVIGQRGSGLDERLANAFEDVGGPAFVIGMDTPQLTPSLILDACKALEAPRLDAVLGPTEDGGYWGLGLKRPERAAIVGVPMSTSTTFEEQASRLTDLGLNCEYLPLLRDVDYFDDACAVAEKIPASEFAYALGRVLMRIAQRSA